MQKNRINVSNIHPTDRSATQFEVNFHFINHDMRLN